MEPFRTDQALIARRNWTLLAAAAAITAAGFGMLILDWTRLVALGGIGSLVWLVGFVLLLVAWRFNPLRDQHKGELTADNHGVSVNGQPVLSRAEVAEGYIQPQADGPIVRLRTRRRTRGLDIKVKNADEAHALLRALNLDASHARVTFWAPSPLMVDLLAQLVMMGTWMLGGMLAVTLAHAAAVAPLLMAVLAVFMFVPKRVVAGADGVRIAWLGPGRFIPYSAVSSVAVDDRGVLIVLRHAEPVHLRFKQPLKSRDIVMSALFAPQQAAIVERIGEGARAHAATVVDRQAAAPLARGGRTASEWLRTLRTLGSGDGADYRTQTIPSEVLWRIAENVAAPPHERAAAAIALRDTLDEEGRARLRSLAEATAAPKVRVVLEAAAATSAPKENGAADPMPPDEEALTRALEECEEDETPEVQGKHAQR